ncbi:hypothetical protein LINPERPRIM_LOCUS22057 [Linum perenne]
MLLPATPEHTLGFYLVSFY